jgi:hypothetical protein
LVASLAAVFLISNISSGIAATAEHKMAHASANASYASNASQAKADEVPANCIRQSCGKLWCWQMSGGKSSSR